MSDALCGPSNALQNFQKHTSVDRTLQQDRLISRQSPSQGFRSQNAHEGALDPEFAAFESNIAGAPLPDLQHPAHFVAHAPHHGMPSQGESASWAGDFQRLQISGPAHPIHQQPGPSAASVSATPQQGWQAEFMNQQRQHTPFQQHQPYRPGFQSSFAPNYSMHGASMNVMPTAQQGTAIQQPSAETFDESAFEAAFEQARADMTSQATNATQETVEPVSEPHQLDARNESVPQEQIRIGSDMISQTAQDNTEGRPNDADELARTAGHLLDSVSHDQSEKFRQSNFLALMRRIRDREVQVEGDEFREVSTSS
ncbi:hypothetical protein BDW42DRAFT_13585 [Aspergillus taichungensis]|uniref:Peroxin 20 n=1 Tax=Aspergillus taichungensis TaxID=482145 RepID=A0A2J5HIR5_9EURO|nr:hypothetical protein BDW42DRAFT_13585 [Aspergillus taichungensis]